MINDVPVEKLIPHRDRMLLVDRIISVEDKSAVTESAVTRLWPVCENGRADALVCIELVAQTAAVCRGYRDYKKNDEDSKHTGWIVGIKKADFAVDDIAVGEQIITRVQNRVEFDNYLEFEGESKIGSQVVANITIQTLGASDEEET